MLTYIYTKDYSDRSSLRQKVTWQARPALFNARVFALAEKYFIHDLEALAAKKYKDCMHRTGYDDLMESVLEVYASASDPDMQLRKTIIAAIFRYIDAFFSTPGGIEAFRQAAETHPSLAADMAEALRQRALEKNNRDDKTATCQDCVQLVDITYFRGPSRMHTWCKLCGKSWMYYEKTETPDVREVVVNVFWTLVIGGLAVYGGVCALSKCD